MKKHSHFMHSLLKAEGGTNSVNRKCNSLRRSCVSSARNAGESAIRQLPAQPDRACRVREMQARAPRAGCPRNPLQRSRVSSARNAGESAICPVRAQPSAERFFCRPALGLFASLPFKNPRILWAFSADLHLSSDRTKALISAVFKERMLTRPTGLDRIRRRV